MASGRGRCCRSLWRALQASRRVLSLLPEVLNANADLEQDGWVWANACCTVADELVNDTVYLSFKLLTKAHFTLQTHVRSSIVMLYAMLSRTVPGMSSLLTQGVLYQRLQVVLILSFTHLFLPKHNHKCSISEFNMKRSDDKRLEYTGIHSYVPHGSHLLVSLCTLPTANTPMTLICVVP